MQWGGAESIEQHQQQQQQAAMLDPACWQHLPVCVGTILKAPLTTPSGSDSSTSYRVGKKLVRKFDVIGLCRSASEFDGYFKCLIDDGTGSIGCTLWKPHPPPPTLHSFHAVRQLDGFAAATAGSVAHTIDDDESRNVTTASGATTVREGGVAATGLTTLGAEDGLAELLLTEAEAALSTDSVKPKPGVSLHVRGLVREFRGNRELSCGYYRVCQPDEELLRLGRVARLADPACQFGYGLRLRLPDGLSRRLCLAEAARDQDTQAQQRLLHHLRSHRLHRFSPADLLLLSGADWLPATEAQLKTSLLEPLVAAGQLRAWLCEDTGRLQYQLCEADHALSLDIVDTLRQLRDSGSTGGGVSELALLGRLRRNGRGRYPGLTEAGLRRLLDKLAEDSRIVCVAPRTYACV